jgi:hypothetical protein
MRFKEDAVGARELRHDDALDAVDDESAVFGHPREICEEYFLLFFFAGRFVLELCDHRERRLVGLHVGFRVLLVPAQIAELEFHELKLEFFLRVVVKSRRIP